MLYRIDITRVMAHYGTAWDEMDDHTTLLEREVAPEVPGRSPVDPLGQERALDIAVRDASKAATFSGSVGSQGRRESIKHIVEREQAPHQHFRGGDPAPRRAGSRRRASRYRLGLDSTLDRCRRCRADPLRRPRPARRGRGRRGAPFRGGNPESSSLGAAVTVPVVPNLGIRLGGAYVQGGSIGRADDIVNAFYADLTLDYMELTAPKAIPRAASASSTCSPNRFLRSAVYESDVPRVPVRVPAGGIGCR